MTKSFYITLLFLSLCKLSFAQNPHNPFVFKQIIDDKGTLSNIISCFLEDSDGFLWVGTMDGLKRYDGNEFTIFKHENGNNNSLFHNDIEALCEDKMGRIWIGTHEGIGYFDKKINQFYKFKEFNKNDYICYNIVCDSEGDVWFSISGQGVFHYSENTKLVQKYAHNPKDKFSISSNKSHPKGIIFDPSKKGIWFDSVEGVNYFEFSSQKFYHKNNNPKNLSILNSEFNRSLVLDGNNLIFFDEDLLKIKYFNLEKQVVIKEIDIKSAEQREHLIIADIFVDKQHNLWLSDWSNHCYFLDVKTLKTSELKYNSAKPTSIGATFFWCAYQQKDGNIWLGTNNGISIVNPSREFYEIFDIGQLFTPLKDGNSLYLFMEDSMDKSWWMAVDLKRFAHYYPQTNKLETFDILPKIDAHPGYIQAFFDQKDYLFILTTKSFHRFDKSLKKITNLPLPDSLNIKRGITNVMKSGDDIWLFCANAKAYSYKISTKSWKIYPILTDVENGIYSSEVDNEGNIWISVQNGLAKFSKEKQSFELMKSTSKIDFSGVGFTILRKDKEGLFWIGSNNLIKFNPKTLVVKPVLDLNIVNDIIIDKENKIWTSAYNDFTIFYPKIQKTLTLTIPISKGNLRWRNYLYTLQSGQLVSLMKSDVVVIDPSKIIPISSTDKVLISKMQSANREILLHNSNSSIDLESLENSFSLNFSTLNPPFEHKYKLFYQLSGHNKNWIPTQNHSVSFSNISGGNYVFKVKGIDNNGHETAVSSLNIHIATIFYKSRWFWALVGLLFAMLAYSFYRFRVKQTAKMYELSMKTKQLELENNVIQYQNLINHLNPHFLFNSLSSLNGMIMSDTKLASTFLEKLSLMYRYILCNKDSQLVNLSREISFLQHYIDLQKTRFEDGFRVEIDVKASFRNRQIVPITLQNLLENAIKHNIVDEDSPLIVKIYDREDWLYVENNLQKKKFVETSNKQGLSSLKSLYHFLSKREMEFIETEDSFVVKIPLL